MPDETLPASSLPGYQAVAGDLYDQPGHLIRRAHQIALGMYADHVSTEVTPPQYAILRMVAEVPGVDQVGLARLVGLDSSTTALTAARLEAKGLLRREVVASNRRQLRLSLTPAGQDLLESLISGVHEMRARLFQSLTQREQEQFMRLLRKFVHLNNDASRAPLQAASSTGAGAKAAKRTRPL